MHSYLLQELKYFRDSKYKDLMKYLMTVAMRGHDQLEIHKLRLEILVTKEGSDFDFEKLEQDLKEVEIYIERSFNKNHYRIWW